MFYFRCTGMYTLLFCLFRGMDIVKLDLVYCIIIFIIYLLSMHCIAFINEHCYMDDK